MLLRHAKQHALCTATRPSCVNELMRAKDQSGLFGLLMHPIYPVTRGNLLLNRLFEFTFQSVLSKLAYEPTIFYDGKILYHETTSEGCRYKCKFTRSMGDLKSGDLAIFSAIRQFLVCTYQAGFAAMVIQ